MMKKSILAIFCLLLALNIAACNGTNTGSSEADRLKKEIERLQEELAKSLANSGDNTNAKKNNNNTSDNPPPSDPETPVNDFEYRYDGGALGVIITKYIGSSLKVRLPEKIEGENVVGIGDNAFKDSGIMSIYIPNTVKSIGNGAFRGCKGLTAITIPESVTSIGNGALSGCIALKYVQINGEPRLGSLILFGGMFWRILDIKDGKALMLSEDVLSSRAYHSEYIDITWENCSFRSYLNGQFYENTFSGEEKAKIIESTIVNSDNTDYGTAGGRDTTDKVFLLSIGEARQYFSDESARIATSVDGSASWWWLRSPGYVSRTAAYVIRDGQLDTFGYIVDYASGGVRPALWLNL